MASFADLLSLRMVNLRRTAKGWTSQCPCCAANGRDLNGKDHLQIQPDGAFFCVAAGTSDKAHNRAIRAFIREGADPLTLATLEMAIVDPEPKLEADTIYPESMLTRLIPDHSYWIGRGISEDVLRRLEGGLVPAEPRGKLSGRYCFPIRDHSSRRIVGWTGRLVSDASFGTKWKHLVKAKRALYPLTITGEAIKRARRVVLVESVGDMLALMTAGIDCVLVLLGCNLNSRMLGYLASANLDEVIISTNTDTERVAPDGTVTYPGQDAAAKIRAKLVPYLGEHKVRIRLPVTRKDWGEVLEHKTGELEVLKAELEGRAPPEPAAPEPFSLS